MLVFMKNKPNVATPFGNEDVAAAAVFLCSDECFLSGQNLQVNGGLTLRRNPRSHEIDASVAAAVAELESK